ncbi:helix-turn-helix transcriptional regulator [Streptomyces sp. NBC_00338]|uniref:helix-turn-helix transcriptional regulator n=1 Tax=Streptomyces sp. NBC_00338 TaxID=2975715 RepID=UPI002252B83B|nr:helix-turn-helix transcriptional regulator [Streptomyces sp. NBC_00338]MCX5141257.1 helix-turn-helix transcriptional regulator [Streptomyces sp. NBC_00338]
MTAPPVHEHSDRGLCDAAVSLYAEALGKGSLARSATEATPCLVDTALLLPDPHDSGLLRPVPHSVALARLLRPLAQGLVDQVRASDLLARALVPLTSFGDAPHHSIDVIVGPPAIQAGIARSLSETHAEILTIQPGSTRSPEELRTALAGTLPTVERDVRLRHIYQHSARYSPALKAYMGQLPSSLLQVRTMEQVVDRLLIFDRKVAYLPASPDRSAALEIRHPALVGFLAGIYETLWEGATPFTQQLPTTLPGVPVTAVQHSIARLLIEGKQDEAVARTLGISVRTCRAHIAKLMQILGATSRTHLGALLVRSGIAEPVPPVTTTEKPAAPDVPG